MSFSLGETPDCDIVTLSIRVIGTVFTPRMRAHCVISRLEISIYVDYTLVSIHTNQIAWQVR